MTRWTGQNAKTVTTFFSVIAWPAGELRDVEVYSGPIVINNKEFLYSIVHDITERRTVENKIQHMAFHDYLTGLPNRTYLYKYLKKTIEQVNLKQLTFSVMFLDLDEFKSVNDNYGHAAGDLLLQQAARRLTGCVRENDLVARVGGDEFVVVLSPATERSDEVAIAQRIISKLNSPFQLGEFQAQISTSIGIAHYPQHGPDSDQILKCADSAMYAAKEQGKNK
ncbi:MAG: GGDEF domain-containing protein [Bacillota bacterium]|nr:GGDEF domain-containing protein [Bacillota bacterium]MDW7682966.1 GGDEF domain-containing protein [Bacillota bacterium]